MPAILGYKMISLIILAIIQALTEFIPVSSSGHLLAVNEIAGLDGSLAVDVALHFGTLLALVVYFWSRLIGILLNLKTNYELVLRLVITSIPAAIAGYFFEDLIVSDARSLGVVIVMLVVVGLLMVINDKIFMVDNKKQDIESISRFDALVIGFGQALALIPGTSRSGITMLSAKQRGLSDRLAAEYAFLVGIPIIFGASLKVILEAESRAIIEDQLMKVLVGVILSFVVGLVVLRFLIDYVSRHGLKIFGLYRLVLAGVLFIIWLK